MPENDQVTVWRKYLKDSLAKLKLDFVKYHSPKRAFKQHCKIADSLLLEVWKSLNIDDRCCLIAVGGYGRGELYPYSDIDLLILLPEALSSDSKNIVNNHLNQGIEAFIGLLWDVGLNVGHSVRTLDECISEAAKDITIKTNLIESRLLAGEHSFYNIFVDKVEASIDVKHFFTAKLQEQDNRHAKFNDTAYNLEPNVKESPGGLRDLHMILWLSNVSRIKNNQDKAKSKRLIAWSTLKKLGLVSALEARQIKHHEKKLQLIRFHLHFLSNRREDRLLFDFQNELASAQGYINTASKRASEQLMQGYYRSVKFIELMNEILIKSLQLEIKSASPDKEINKVQELNENFQTHNQLLEVKSVAILQKNPSAILEAFLLLQRHPEIKGMSANLLRNLQRVKNLVNKDFRQNRENKKLFISILSQPNGVNQTLRAMNRYGILGSYIPAFGKIVGQMQHDLFHVYTVDEHILNVLANLRRFAKPDLKHEFPLCTQLFAAFDAPHLLYLAALFHDIAKGRGGDHSKLGTVDAYKFCKQHLLTKDESELVAWLVEVHLKMSSTAQKSDLSDLAVIETFAQCVQNERRLTALYLLTVADIRGTSPLVWNAWKARLLESLFQATKRALANIALLPSQVTASRREEASTKLKTYNLFEKSYASLWERFGEHYFTRYEGDEIAWHTRLLIPHLNSKKPIIRARLSPSGDGIQVMIYTQDRKDLFARICNFFDRMSYSIVEAKIYTTPHGYALNSFLILDASGKSVSYSGLMRFIEVELTQKLEKESSLELPLKGRLSRQVKHMPIQPKVTLSREADNNNHLLEIVANDRPGLLASLAVTFLNQKVELHTAKINTLGNRAEDTFLISGSKGQLLNQERIKDLEVLLKTAL